MRAVRWTALLLCGAGLLRDVSVHVWKEHPLRAAKERRRPDTPYTWIPGLLPAAVDRVAFLTDARAGSDEYAKRLYDARYGLCPRVLDEGLATRFAVAEVSRSADLEAFSRASGFTVVDSRGTVALLVRR
ncbi:MAG: hypothetical protein ACJ79O_17135 [Myxococcales bacterium]